MPHKRYRGLFYNTAPLGLGHLIRSINLCKGLIQTFDIDYLLGSPSPFPFPKSPHFKLHQLTPLIKESKESPYSDPNGKLDLQTIRLQRLNFIDRFITEKYDFLIFEHFPFGRFEMLDELALILQKVTLINPKCLITTSHNGETITRSEGSISYTDYFLTNFFDYIFLHVDPSIEPTKSLLSTFPQHKNKFIHTGYVTDPTHKKPTIVRDNKIIVSSGAGTYSNQLYLPILAVAPLLPEYQFVLLLGPRSDPSIKQQVEEHNKSAKSHNIQCYPFQTNILDLLSSSALSISLGGGGTLVDILQSGIPALILPHPGPKDQETRVSDFQNAKRVGSISENDLEPNRFKELILKTIATPLKEQHYALDGAAKTTNILLDLLEKKSNACQMRA